MTANTRRRGRSLGLSLAEVALSLGVTAMATVGLLQLQQDSSNQIRATAVGTQMQQVLAASEAYIKANQASLMTAAAGGPVSILAGRATSAASVPTGSLQAANFLPQTFVNTNSFGQRYYLVVRRNGATLEGLVTAVGGRVINDVDLGRIAARIGAAGGARMSNVANTTIRGTGGGWAATPGDWTTSASGTPAVGRPAATLAFATNTALADYLYRNDIGVPEANRMNTNIDMGGGGVRNDINNAGHLDSQELRNSNGSGSEAIVVAAQNVLRTDGGLDVCRTAGVANCQIALFENRGSLRRAADGFFELTSTTAATGLRLAGSGDNLEVGGDASVGGSARFASQNSGQEITARNQRRTVNGAPVDFLSLAGAGSNQAGLWSQSEVVASIFRDVNNQNFFVDPASTSRLATVITNFVGANGLDPTTGYPPGWGGGIRAWDVYANGSIGTGDPGQPANAYMNSAGTVFARQQVLTRGDVLADGAVRAGREVVSSSYIQAAGDVSAGFSVVANEDVRAGSFITAGYDITAGRDLRATRDAAVGRNLTVTGQTVFAGNARAADGASIRTGLRSSVGAGCESGTMAINNATGSMLFCRNGAYEDPAAGIIGIYRGGGGAQNSFSCDPGYSLYWHHLTVGNTNNAFLPQCVKTGYF